MVIRRIDIDKLMFGVYKVTRLLPAPIKLGELLETPEMDNQQPSMLGIT